MERIKRLFRKDEMGVEPYLYVLFWICIAFAAVGYSVPVLTLMFGW